MADFDTLAEAIAEAKERHLDPARAVIEDLVNDDQRAIKEWTDGCMTDTERKVMEVLIKSPKSSDAFKDPIHAVDRAMASEQWDTAKSTSFVQDMLNRKLVKTVTQARNVNEDSPGSKWWWEKGDMAD